MNGPSGSGPVHTAPNTPPGTSTRWISASVGIGSIQCQDDDANTPCAEPSGTGIASPRPASARTPGSSAASTRAHPVVGLDRDDVAGRVP